MSDRQRRRITFSTIRKVCGYLTNGQAEPIVKPLWGAVAPWLRVRVRHVVMLFS